MSTAMENFVRYARANLRLHAKASPRDWSDQEVVDSHFLTPPPFLTFEVWAESLGLKSGEQIVSQPGPTMDSSDVVDPKVALGELVAAGIAKVEVK